MPTEILPESYMNLTTHNVLQLLLFPRSKTKMARVFLESLGKLTRTFRELIFRRTFTWRPPSGKLSMFKNWSRLSLFSFLIFEDSPAQISKFFLETSHHWFCHSRNTRTDLSNGLLPSGMSSKCLFAGVDFLTSPSVDFFTNE